MAIKEKIMEFMRDIAYKPMELNEIAKIFSLTKNEQKDLKKILKVMESEGIILKNKSEKYGLVESMGLIKGKFIGHQKGFGFVNIMQEGASDIYINANEVHGAMHGDIVLVKILKEGGNDNRRSEGEIVKVIERSNKTIVGIYESSQNFGFVIPEEKKIYNDIFIPKTQKGDAKDGDVVIIEITQWPDGRRNPEGKVVEVLGKKGQKGVDILTIIKKFNLPEEFPEKVEEYAANIQEEIPQEEYDRRRDLRNLVMVTIDGEDAKDLDDAVSLELLENGNYKLGVHIADVSHYVREKNTLDKEALKRATSVYLIDRVIPMLPKKLSNGICSLNPKVDRLAMSCFMEINKAGKVVANEVFESVIKTSERMTYTDVTKILVENDEELIKRYDYLVDMFKDMEKLCKILNKKRMDRGAIDFDFAESKIILDEFGKAVDVKPYERAIANRIIEEFMLVCNETVAEYMFWSNIPFIYRIHEDPKEEKLDQFYEFIHNLGHPVKRTKEVFPGALQEIVDTFKGKKEETVVSTLLLRSMMQARYSPESLGHFGLAAKYYSHFTSPIRRYPDLMIHRIIKEFLNGGIGTGRMEKLAVTVDYASRQSSDMERLAQEAEREVDDLKKAEYMADKVGEIYEGIISSVTSFGFFVELPNTVEGLVHISALHDDYYNYDERHLCLIGDMTKNTYRLGDEIKIKVERVDVENKEVYFAVYNENADEEANDRDSFRKGKKKNGKLNRKYVKNISKIVEGLSLEEVEAELKGIKIKADELPDEE